jgi:pimeloyl-ACP methyl ester carboxylesterase
MSLNSGHGKSSWLPDGASYHTYGFLPTVLALMHELKWDKISFIAHSMGANVSFVFAAIFPEKVDILVSVEGFKPLRRETSQLVRMLRNSTDKFLIADMRNRSQSEPPSYTLDELTELLIKGTRGSVTRATAIHLLERNIKPSQTFSGKFFFSRDGRMKHSFDIGLPQSVAVDLARSIKTPFLVIRAAKSHLFEKPIYHEEAIEAMRDAPHFEYHSVDSSSHHIHLTEPEKIAAKMSDFIREHKIKFSSRL